ncbi:MAG: ArsR family transcriptional regulator [Acidobacteriota bacterium]
MAAAPPDFDFILVITKICGVLLESSALSAIASARRREILRLIWENELAAGDIHRAMPDITFGAISLQLRTLSEAGLVDCRPEKTRRFYRARRAALGSVGQALERMWDDALWRLKLAAELETTRRGPKPQGGPGTSRRPGVIRHGARRKTSKPRARKV